MYVSQVLVLCLFTLLRCMMPPAVLSIKILFDISIFRALIKTDAALQCFHRHHFKQMYSAPTYIQETLWEQIEMSIIWLSFKARQYPIMQFIQFHLIW
jgi:hypothetical protein